MKPMMMETSSRGNGWVGSSASQMEIVMTSTIPCLRMLELCDGQYNDCTNVDSDASSAPIDEADNDGDTQVEYRVG